MAMLNMYNEIKKIHPKYILFIKSGTFFETMNNDAYIINNIFKYTIKDKTSYLQCGFPKIALAKVINKIEQKKINYIVLDSTDNYDELERYDYEDLNRYDYFLEKGKREYKRKQIIEEYHDYLLQNSERKFMDKLLQEIGDLIDKSREI